MSFAPPPAPRSGPPPAQRTRRGTVVFASVVVVVLVLVAAVIVVVARRAPVQPAEATAAPALSGPATWGPQTALPLKGLVKPEGLAVTPAGAVYVICCKQPPKAELWIDEPGASFPTRQSLPYPTGGIAVDHDGNVYLADTGKISKLTVGATAGGVAETKLPFPNPDVPMGIAVDGAGAVYVLHWKFVDASQAKTSAEIWKLDPGAQIPVVTPLNGVKLALAIAVDQGGTVYVADGAGRRVLKFAPGASEPTDLPVPEGTPNALAVDGSGAVYVATAPVVSDGMLFRFPAGGTGAEKLPLDGARWTPGSTVGLGVDQDGNVYLADHDHDRVLKIPRKKG